MGLLERLACLIADCERMAQDLNPQELRYLQAHQDGLEKSYRLYQRLFLENDYCNGRVR